MRSRPFRLSPGLRGRGPKPGGQSPLPMATSERYCARGYSCYRTACAGALAEAVLRCSFPLKTFAMKKNSDVLIGKADQPPRRSAPRRRAVAAGGEQPVRQIKPDDGVNWQFRRVRRALPFRGHQARGRFRVRRLFRLFSALQRTKRDRRGHCRVFLPAL